MLTSWHPDETLEEVVEFAKHFDAAGNDNEKNTIIEI